jgi:hypothetical protein
MTKIKVIIDDELYQEYKDSNFHRIFTIFNIKHNIADYFYNKLEDDEQFYGDSTVIVKADNETFDISYAVADIVNEYIETSEDEAEGQKDIERSFHMGLI